MSGLEIGLIAKVCPRFELWGFCRTLRAAIRMVAWAVFLSTVSHTVSHSAESIGETECPALPSDVVVDRAWGGSRVRFDALENARFIYIAYYDADRWLSVTQINKCTGRQEKIRIPSRFTGWDPHNSIVLAVDQAGRLHVSGNMHVSSLVYAHMDVADMLAGLDMLRPMLGVDELRTTYPYFFHFADGALGFSYRFGQSGNGIEIINRLQESQWTRWTDRPIFAPSSQKNSVNAYHSGFILGPDGFFHVAWVWRKDYRVETNFDVSYAKSTDLRSWKNSWGETVGLPITPVSAEVVDHVPEGSGLFNNIRLGFDKIGRPVISYLKFDATGATQLFHARREEAGWKSVPATKWTYRWDPRGGGSIPSEITFSGVKVLNGRLIEQVRQPQIGLKTFVYAGDSLKLQETLKAEGWDAAHAVQRRQGPEGAVLNVRAVRIENVMGGRSKYHYAVSWFSHPDNNNGKTRECKPVGLPCDFVSELILHTEPVMAEPAT